MWNSFGRLMALVTCECCNSFYKYIHPRKHTLQIDSRAPFLVAVDKPWSLTDGSLIVPVRGRLPSREECDEGCLAHIAVTYDQYLEDVVVDVPGRHP